MRWLIALAVACALAGCATHKPRPDAHPQHATAVYSTPRNRSRTPPAFVSRGPYTPGGLYAPGVADSAPDMPEDVSALSEPVPKNEPLSRYGNRTPYTVLGVTYNVLPSAKGYDERGIASWYGTKFHGRATSNFEPYDMYQFTGAHKTLPLPSYVRVTNLDNGRSVIVRINDRGPFHVDRLIDLSYAAAVRLGVNITGTARVEVRAIDPDDADSDHAATAASHDGTPATTASGNAALPTIDSRHAYINIANGYLQVASFGERGNAESVLARLRDAGIDGASMRAVEIDGRSFWRVLIGPLQAAAAARVAEQIQALGLGHPRFSATSGGSD